MLSHDIKINWVITTKRNYQTTIDARNLKQRCLYKVEFQKNLRYRCLKLSHWASGRCYTKFQEFLKSFSKEVRIVSANIWNSFDLIVKKKCFFVINVYNYVKNKCCIALFYDTWSVVSFLSSNSLLYTLYIL